jgi:hypothetical protein
MRTGKHGPVTGGAAPAAVAGAQGDGVTRWTVTRLGLIEAIGEVPGSLFDAFCCPGCDPGGAEADLADAILAVLPDGGQSGTRAEAPAFDLLSLAADLDRRADRADEQSLTRGGMIRARVLREAAGMARRRAGGVRAEQAPAAFPVAPGAPDSPPGVS